MSYTPCLTKPAAKNRYYNTKANGGYSTAIVGNKTTGCWSSTLNVLPNCVGWAKGRFNEIGGYGKIKYDIKGNAEDWFANAKALGLSVGQTPKLGAVMVWSKGKVGNGTDGAGHVAVVEIMYNNESVITSESGWGASKQFWTQSRTKGNGNWGQSSAYKFLGFIYNPAVTEQDNKYTCPYVAPVVTLKKGATGTGVKWLQWQLNQHKIPVNIDGSFGNGTLTAVKLFQKQNGLAVDGSVGPATRKALLK